MGFGSIFLFVFFGFWFLVEIVGFVIARGVLEKKMKEKIFFLVYMFVLYFVSFTSIG